MDAEITLELKGKNTGYAITALEEIWSGHDLTSTYEKTRFSPIIPQKSFSFGYTGTDVRLLGRMTNNKLILNLENTINASDFKQTVTRINDYYYDIRKGLREKHIMVTGARAIITIDRFQIPGVMRTRWQDLQDDIIDKKDKLFIEPLSAVVISFLALRFGFVKVEDQDKNLIKIFIAMAEVYFGVIIVYLGKFIFKKSRKKFSFSVE